jgi:MMP 1-O-methyltransferase
MNPLREDLAFRTLGWLHDTDGPTLHRYALECDGPFAELGSFAGKSTIWIGDAAQQRDTIVWAVDWHRGSPEMDEGEDCHIPEAIDPVTRRHDTLRLLRATVDAADLEDVIIPIAGTSQTVGRWWQGDVGFLFIDACHDAPVIVDYQLWGPRVRSGGILAFHDSPIPVIAQAIRMAKADGFETVEVVNSLTVLRR